MNWLDTYIFKNDTGYLISSKNGLFVNIDDNYVKWVKGNKDPIGLKDISKDNFISILIG